jgi:protein-S-isoprenylcysteine O-methyltransferase Ste14
LLLYDDHLDIAFPVFDGDGDGVTRTEQRSTATHVRFNAARPPTRGPLLHLRCVSGYEPLRDKTCSERPRGAAVLQCSRSQRRAVKLIVATVALVVLGVVFLFVRYAGRQPWTPWPVVGLAIAVPAFLLFALARIELGRAFSVQAKASTLVTTGIYVRIRNPIYVFGELMIADVIIWVQRPWWLLIFVLLIPMHLLRVRKEEQVLEAKFGDAYLEYKRKTWF